MTVTGARALFRLPYHHASISMEEREGTTRYASSRDESAGGPSAFGATWAIGGELPEARPGTLEFFLTERYCLYTADGEKLYRARIHHRPWPLRKVRVETYRSSMVEAAGLPAPKGEPLLPHGGPVDVEVWPLAEV